jgi:hypothetical protein
MVRSITCGSRVALWVFGTTFATAAFALHHPEYGSLADSAGAEMLAFAGVFVLFKAAKNAFVHLDLAREFRAVIFLQERPNLLEHPPRALVGNANLPLKLLSTDSASRRSHQEDRVKPEFERRSRILKDCAAHWVFVVAAILTGISWTLASAMMLGDLLALRAKDTIWIEPALQPFETSRVVRELTVKVHLGERAIGYARSDRVVAIGLAHNGQCSK